MLHNNVYATVLYTWTLGEGEFNVGFFLTEVKKSKQGKKIENEQLTAGRCSPGNQFIKLNFAINCLKLKFLYKAKYNKKRTHEYVAQGKYFKILTITSYYSEVVL